MWLRITKITYFFSLYLGIIVMLMIPVGIEGWNLAPAKCLMLWKIGVSLFCIAISFLILNLFLPKKREETDTWTPSENAPHPPGLVDTHDRFTIERGVSPEGELMLGLARWRYDQVWQRAKEWEREPRLFPPSHWEEIEAWENQLREQAVELNERAVLRLGEQRARKREAEEALQIAGFRELVS